MTHEAAAVDDETAEGAGGDTVTVGKVEGDTLGEGVVEDKSQGGIGVSAVVSEQQRLWPPSWECC